MFVSKLYICLDIAYFYCQLDSEALHMENWHYGSNGSLGPLIKLLYLTGCENVSEKHTEGKSITRRLHCFHYFASDTETGQYQCYTSGHFQLKIYTYTVIVLKWLDKPTLGTNSTSFLNKWSWSNTINWRLIHILLYSWANIINNLCSALYFLM